MRNLTITRKDKNMMMCCCCCMSDKKNRAYFSYATDTPERIDKNAQNWDWSSGKNNDDQTGRQVLLDAVAVIFYLNFGNLWKIRKKNKETWEWIQSWKGDKRWVNIKQM